MVSFEELTQSIKISKLLKDKEKTTKEAKETLNSVSVLVSAYSISILKEISKNKEITKEDIDRVYKSLE